MDLIQTNIGAALVSDGQVLVRAIADFGDLS